MSIPIVRRGSLVLAVLAALSVAAFAVAPPASQAATLYACAKKNGSARIFSQKPKCRRGERKLSWNTTGPAGRNGTNGVNGTNGKDGTPGQPQKALVFNSTLASSFEPPAVAPLFTVSGVTVQLLCFNFLVSIAKLEATAPASSRAETGILATNEKGETPEIAQEPVKDVALGSSFETIVQLTSNGKGVLRNVGHVNGSILTPGAIVVFDAFVSAGPNPTGCVARGSAFSIPL